MGKHASKEGMIPGATTWATLGGKPTTKSGFGITDVPDISGTPVAEQIAIWTDADTQKGSTKVTFIESTNTFLIDGNIEATGEITAFASGGSGSSIWDSMPLATTTERGGFKLYSTQFEFNASEQLTIKSGVLTPAAHTHDDRYFTEAETTSAISGAIANLVDTAPSTLDTLNELAAALGDDPNFATTVTNLIATKAPINNPTFTGTVGGITKAMVGLGNVDNESKATMFTNPVFTGGINIGGAAGGMVLPASSGATRTGFFRLGYSVESWAGVELNCGIVNNDTIGYPAWIQAQTPGAYGTSRPLYLNPNGGDITCGAALRATSLKTTNWTFEESGNDLLIKRGATTLFRLSSAGYFKAKDEIEAFVAAP